jgi:murein DD-endopeptidase MepM/ murein hydrolase activator NlpD
MKHLASQSPYRSDYALEPRTAPSGDRRASLELSCDPADLTIAASAEPIATTGQRQIERPANRLLTVQFNQQRHRLEILAAKPLVPQIYGSQQSSQLWIDLPHVQVDRTSLQREVGQTIKFIQVEPLSSSSTRIWLAMTDAVALQPHLIELQAQAANYWFVQLASWRSMCDRRLSGRHPPGLDYVVPLAGEIQVAYGWRIHPIFKDWQFHRGLDIAAPAGTPVVAAAAGTVIFAGWNNSGYGNLLVLEHGNRSKTLYAHNHKLLVRRGEPVEAGQAIALTGNTGKSRGSHLHFELLPDGKHTANPVDYLPLIDREGGDLATKAISAVEDAITPNQADNYGNYAQSMVTHWLADQLMPVDRSAIGSTSQDCFAISASSAPGWQSP